MGTSIRRLSSPAFLPGIPAPQLLEVTERMLAHLLNGVNPRDRALVDQTATHLERELGLSYLLNEAASAARLLEESHPTTAANLRRAVERFTRRE